MLPQGLGLLEHADVELGATTALLGQLGQRDRAGEAGRPCTHDHDVQLHAVAGAGGADGHQEPVER